MTREQAEKLIETYCVDEPTGGAVARLTQLDAGYPNTLVDARELIPNHYVILSGEDEHGQVCALPQNDLDAILYEQTGETLKQ